ncbi:hypothetical protein P9112_004795 [Eukaryota sp. TZLM1-RC]
MNLQNFIDSSHPTEMTGSIQNKGVAEAGSGLFLCEQDPFAHLTPLNKTKEGSEEHWHVPQVLIHNVGATFNVKCKLDLRHIARYVKNSEYNPRRTSFVILRLEKPRATAWVYANGNINIIGAKGEEEATKVAPVIYKQLRKANFPVRLEKFQITNVMGTIDMGIWVDVRALHMGNPRNTEFDSEHPHSVTLLMNNPRVKAVIYHTGKIKFNSAKSRKDIDIAAKEIQGVVRKFKI